MPRQLKLPGNYNGSKRRAAPLIWRLLGDLDYYVEPFCGWAAVFYGRPAPEPTRTRRMIEVLGDANGLIANLHRAVKYDPAGLATTAAWPAIAIDLDARSKQLADRHPQLRNSLLDSPHFYDLELAAWTLWGSIVGIGGFAYVMRGNTGIIRGNRRPPTRDWLEKHVTACSTRLQDAYIYAGDWTILARAAPLTTKLDKQYGQTCGIYLDPPYGQATNHYNAEPGIADKVRAWCINDAAPWVRTVLSGYDDEHDELLDHGWTKHQGLAHHGTGKNGTEMLWASPACLDPDSPPDARHLEETA